MTANLRKGLTVKQAAMAMNVSERAVYMAGEVLRSGRDDLIAACEQGRMSLLGAVRQIRAKPPETGLDRLKRAWRNATPDEREAFMQALVDAGTAQKGQTA